MNGSAGNGSAGKRPGMEPVLARLLQYGTWLASIAIGAGLALTLVDSRFGAHGLGNVSSMRVATAGIALFILLPSLRVFAMLLLFLRERDYRFSGIAALVLTIILLGFLLGIRTAATGG